MQQSIYCVYITTYRGNKLPPFYIGSSTIEKIEQGYIGSVSSKQYKQTWKQEFKNNPNLFRTRIVGKFATQKEAIHRELFIHKQLNVVKSELYINKSEARKNGYFGMIVTGKDHPSFGRPRNGIHPRGMSGKKHSIITKLNMSINRRGKNSHHFGKPKSEESKLKMSLAKKGIPLTESHKESLSKAFSGKPKSDAHKEKIALANKGKIKSDSHKQNLKKALDNVREERRLGVREPIQPRSLESRNAMSEKHKNMPDLTCPHCNKTGGHSGMLTWHFNNCKLKLKEVI